MAKILYKAYKELFDVKLKDSLFLIMGISFLIISVWILIPSNNIDSLKNNVLDVKAKNTLSSQNLIIIDWKKYRVYFEEVE